VGKKPAGGRPLHRRNKDSCACPNADADRHCWMMRREEATRRLASRSVVVLNEVFSLAFFSNLGF
jgi:hypothetical protein